MIMIESRWERYKCLLYSFLNFGIDLRMFITNYWGEGKGEK